MEETLKSCGFCSKACTKACGNCQQVSYCSVDCQKKDRKRHKYDCFPLEREPNVCTRPHEVNYFATRNIKQGEVVFKDSPLCVGPISAAASVFGSPGYASLVADGPEDICLGCCIIVNKSSRCQDCSWPLCGPTCYKLNLHKSAECPVFLASNVLPQSNMSNWVKYAVVRYVRALLLRSRDKFKWDQLLNLYRFCDQVTDISAHNMDTIDRKVAVGFIQTKCRMIGFDKATINKIITIDSSLGIVCFGSKSDYATSPLIQYNSRFADSMKHSCAPNLLCMGEMIDLTEAPKLHGTIKAFAVVDIKKGDKLTISVLQDGLEETTLERRKRIHEHTGLWCICPRCSDPTELGTYYSAFKCRKCLSDYMLPTDSLNFQSRWKCGNCSSGLTHTEVEKMFDMIRSEIASLSDTASEAGFGTLYQLTPVAFTADTLSVLSQMKEGLEKLQDRVHPNFFGIYNVQCLILNGLYCRLIRIPEVSNVHVRHERLRILDEMEDIAQYCYKIVNTLYPGLSMIRGRRLFFVAMSKWLKLQEVMVSGGCVVSAENLAKEAMDLYGELEDVLAICGENSLSDRNERTMYVTAMNYIVSIVVSSAEDNPTFSGLILPILNAT